MRLESRIYERLRTNQKGDTQRHSECIAVLSYKNKQLEPEQQRAGLWIVMKMLLPLSLASALPCGFLAKVKKDLHEDKNFGIFSILLDKWMLKSACYWSSQWTSHLKGNEQLDVILCSLSPNFFKKCPQNIFVWTICFETSVWKEGL